MTGFHQCTSGARFMKTKEESDTIKRGVIIKRGIIGDGMIIE
jgi:hypothetical protein